MLNLIDQCEIIILMYWQNQMLIGWNILRDWQKLFDLMQVYLQIKDDQ
jgi:hypothetical protein